MVKYKDVNMIEKKTARLYREKWEFNKGNRIFIKDGIKLKEVTSIKGCSISFLGFNSVIVIEEGAKIAKCTIFVGEGVFIQFGRNFTVRFNLTLDARAKNSTIVFGNNCNIGTASIYSGDEPNLEIIVGNDFLAALNLMLRNSDGHTICDQETGRIINQPQFGIHIGNHVWCGYNVSILKDAEIPDNCVVAACAVVGKKKFFEHSIIAGIPAKVVKRNIVWHSCQIDRYVQLNPDCLF